MRVHHNWLQNPLTRTLDAADRLRLQDIFPRLSGNSTDYFLCLRPYANSVPERFFSRNIHRLSLEWLIERDQRQRTELIRYFSTFSAELGLAFLFLRQINAEDWHDRSIETVDDYDTIRYIDKQIHPTYLRLVEGVFAPFIRPFAHFMRLDRNRATDNLDVYHLVQELSATSMAPCVSAYCQIVRNGIGHGGITYLHRQIRYEDKRGNIDTLDMSSVIGLCDDMLDICNGLASAVKLFVVLSQEKSYVAPREMLIEELVEETHTPWWKVEGCVESEIQGKRQLTIYARPNSSDVIKIQWAAVQTAIMAELLAPNYVRYFISLKSPKVSAGWAAFSGTEIRRQRELGIADVAGYVGSFEETGLFYFPKHPLPRFFGKLETLIYSFKIHLPIAVRQFRTELKLPEFTCRNAKMHRNSWGFVLDGSVVISEMKESAIMSIIRTHKRKIIRIAARKARSSITWHKAVRYLPLGYARIGVFSKDYRRRRLANYGLGPDLICTLQLKRIHRIKSPDIFGSTVETIGKWRIAWNRAWLQSVSH